MVTVKKMTPQQALKTLDKLLKWRTGQLENWDSKNRVPPNTTMRRMYAAAKDALEVVDKIGLEAIDLENATGVLVKVEPGRRLIELTYGKTKSKYAFSGIGRRKK